MENKKILGIYLSRSMNAYELSFVKADVVKENKIYSYVENCESIGLSWIFSKDKILNSQLKGLDLYDSEKDLIDSLNKIGANLENALTKQKSTITKENDLWDSVVTNIEFSKKLKELKSLNKAEIESINEITKELFGRNIQKAMG